MRARGTGRFSSILVKQRATARRLGSLALLGAAVALLARALSAVDLGRAAALLGRAGPLVALALVPYALCLALDAAATRTILRALGERVGFARLLALRFCTEAVHLSLPGGAVVADSMNPFLLEGHAGVPLSVAAVSVGGRKWLIMRAHGMYLVFGALVGWSALVACSAQVLGGPWLPWLVLASASVPLVLSLAMSGALAGRSVASMLHAALSRIPLATLRGWLDRKRAGFVAADGHIEVLARRSGARAWKATALFLAVWLVESLETWMLLRIVGADIGFGGAIAIESGLSLVRSAALFAPAGLGVQDLGYMAFLGALGLPDAGATSAAFVLLKRGKELAWIAIGYATLAALRAAEPAAPGSSPATGAAGAPVPV